MLQKSHNSQETFLGGATAVPDFTDESFALFFSLIPISLYVHLVNLCFTTIIIQIKFRNISILLAAALVPTNLLVKALHKVCQKADNLKLPPCCLSSGPRKKGTVHHDSFFWVPLSGHLLLSPHLWSPGSPIMDFWGIWYCFASVSICSKSMGRPQPWNVISHKHKIK